MQKRDVAFVYDLYSWSWYNKQVTAIVLYSAILEISRYFDPARQTQHILPIEPLRAQKILRAKLFAEFVSLLESFGILCLAIRNRSKKSILWSFLNTEPQEVNQFFQNVLQKKKLSVHGLLKLPRPSEFNRATSDADSPLSGLNYPQDTYNTYVANIRLIAEMYRDAGGLNVITYNKIKHGFNVFEGTALIEPPLDLSDAHVIVETSKLLESGRLGKRSLSLDQDKVDVELENIKRVTDMGSELLALVITLDKIGLLYRGTKEA